MYLRCLAIKWYVEGTACFIIGRCLMPCNKFIPGVDFFIGVRNGSS